MLSKILTATICLIIVSGCAQRGPSSSKQDNTSYEPIFMDTDEHRHGQYRHSHAGGQQVHSHPTRRRSPNQSQQPAQINLPERQSDDRPTLLPKKTPRIL